MAIRQIDKDVLKATISKYDKEYRDIHGCGDNFFRLIESFLEIGAIDSSEYSRICEDFGLNTPFTHLNKDLDK
jgi:hypothetical protein